MSEATVLNVMTDALDYCMDHKNAGKCLIFDHEYFADPKENPRRTGTKEDVKRIETFFSDRLDFEVSTYTDFKKKELVKKIKLAADQNFSDYNCLVVCILTHGTETQLNAFDGIYKLESIITFFRAERCPSLAGKPKLFFIEACQGHQTDPGHELRLLSATNSGLNNGNSVESLSSEEKSDEQSLDEGSDEVDGHNPPIVSVKIPICADILVAYSTVPKYYSFRNPKTGSWFFEILMEALEQHYKQYDLITILTITKQRIAFEKESKATNHKYKNKKQIPWITDTLTRRVFFKESVEQN